MKSFDPMNGGDDNEFERQLLEMELRRPPAHWKAMLLRPPVTPWFPKPFVIGIAVCWTVTAAFILATPPAEKPGPSVVPSFEPQEMPRDLLGYHTTERSIP